MQAQSQYVRVFAGSVIPPLTDGSQIAIQVSKLSDEDRNYTANAYRDSKEAATKLQALETQRLA